MSIKASVFTGLLYGQGPASTYSYLILVPELTEAGFLVSSFSLPVLNRSSVEFDYMGERISMPAGYDTTGTWNFKVTENPSLAERYKLLNATTLNYKTKLFTSIHIYILQNEIPTPAFTLKNAWFKGRAAHPFGYDQVTQPWVWDVTVLYNGIEETVGITDIPLVRMGLMFSSQLVSRGLVSPLTRELANIIK